MIARLPGWGDEDVLALLALFRKHLSHYIYASDKDFSHVVHAELPDKPTCEIQEMVKSLMRQFGLVLSTKNFRNEVIVMNGKEIFVHEHIYESISQLPENKAGGGAWLPDELSRFFQKAKQYRSILSTKQEVYFKRIQIWDWTDINDPYALGYLAFKSTCLRNLAVRKKRRNKTLDLGIRPGRPKRRPSSSSARETTVNNPMDHSVNNPQVSSAKPAVGVDDIMNLHNLNSPSNTDLDLVAGVRRNNSRAQQRAATLPTKAYAAFVRDIGEQCQWTDKVAHNVLRCMQHSIDLYRANKLVEFFRIVASLTPGVSFQELLVNAEYILTTFKQRFGTLDGFENLALTSPNASSTATTNAQAAEQKNGAFAATSENDPNDTDATIDLPSDSIEQQEADANTREQQDELSPESPGQLGTEDAIDEHSSSTAEKQSSPEDTWEIGNEEAAGYVAVLT
ncbi:hypothetical protein PHYBOEH_006416 [Phytophthora boehmeriae]|uniref:Uncharacterized protein n=1 Tax=Phytophthora boehmeriae TaxID=109152 RepID=A0A8T1X966_9STRA|nr:hypothetical protein PHYBOEH_006416 [Phytophthora boehmeriae]